MSSRSPLEFSLLNVLDVLQKARFSSAKWRPLGLRLIPDLDLDAIQANNATVEERLEKVIDKWQRHGDKPSWETLAEAVSRCDGGGKNVGRRILEQAGLAEPLQQHQEGSDLTRVGSEQDEEHPPNHEFEHQTSADSAFDEQSITSPVSPQSALSLSELTPMDDKLTKEDAMIVFEEIKEAKKCSFAIGYQLKIPFHNILKIKNPQDRLRRVLIEYSNLQTPKPTRRGIADALKSELVKFPHLAEKIEARYRTRRNVQVEVEKLQRKFAKLRSAACTAVANTQIDVASFVNVIVGLPGVRGAHDRNFFMEHSDKLRESKSVHSVFDRLACHWDYLHPEMYGQLIRNMPALADLRPDEEAYRNELNGFLDQTPVDEFCKIPGIEHEKDTNPPPGFTELVSKHIWNPPPPVSLRKVEEYRCKFAHTCNLQSCAVAIASIKLGSVIITMWVPESIELKLTLEFINAHNIIHMVLGGIVVHSQEPSELGTFVDPIPRVKVSRAGVALHLVAKMFFKKPAIRLLRHWKTSLTVAAEHGALDEVLELIALGEDPNPHRISTPLKEACHRGDMEMARVLLEAGADPNLVTDNWTPLMEASRLGNADMIRLLMEYGADPNTINGENWTALMAASRNGRYEAVDVLLQHGADPNMQDHVGWSALLAAVHDHHEDIALRLTEAGANPHFQNTELLCALRLAIENDNQDRVVDAFLDRHPDVKPGLRGAPEIDWPDKYDETDLLHACKKKSWRIAKRILHKGANPNLSNRDGESPLLSAIGYEEIEMVEELLNANADPNMATVLSHPLTLAGSLNNVDIIILLEQHGANAPPAPEGKQSKSTLSWIYQFAENLYIASFRDDQ